MVGLLGRYRNQDTVARLERVLAGAGQDPVSSRTVRSPQRRLRKLSSDEVNELVQLRSDGTEINELAIKFGVNRDTVMRHLQNEGVPKQRWPGRTLTPECLQEAGQLYASGLSAIKVAQQFGVDRRYLRRVLPEAGFPLRAPGRRKASSD
jgi:DNA invertase Pin-like site-specific DNA recombinase